jgi:hypothetical protein
MLYFSTCKNGLKEFTNNVKNDLEAIQRIVDTGADATRIDLKNELSETIKKEIKPLKQDIRRIKKDVGVMLTSFDRRDIRPQKRVRVIENSLNIFSS